MCIHLIRSARQIVRNSRKCSCRQRQNIRREVSDYDTIPEIVLLQPYHSCRHARAAIWCHVHRYIERISVSCRSGCDRECRRRWVKRYAIPLIDQVSHIHRPKPARQVITRSAGVFRTWRSVRRLTRHRIISHRYIVEHARTRRQSSGIRRVALPQVFRRCQPVQHIVGLPQFALRFSRPPAP